MNGNAAAKHEEEFNLYGTWSATDALFSSAQTSSQVARLQNSADCDRKRPRLTNHFTLQSLDEDNIHFDYLGDSEASELEPVNRPLDRYPSEDSHNQLPDTQHISQPLQCQQDYLQCRDIPTHQDTIDDWFDEYATFDDVGSLSLGLTESVQEELGQEIVCYGALKNFEEIWLDVEEQSTVCWSGGSSLSVNGNFTQLSDRSVTILSSLSETADAIFEFYLLKATDGPTCSAVRPQKRRLESVKWAVTVVIYGPKDVADDVGQWFGAMKLYLETPSKCAMNVPYINPHRLSDELAPTIMTHQLNVTNDLDPESNSHDVWLASNLYTTQWYEEAAQPILLRSKLHSHQLQALTFMQGREAGWDVHNERSTNDLWQYVFDPFGQQKYIEALSGQSSFKAPPQFRGGFLADEMGLGKTCSMLAVIAADIESRRAAIRSDNNTVAAATHTTLVVVPLPLLQVWEKQIKEHFHHQAISYTTYYGNQKDADMSFYGIDIVLTTYGTVSQEWRTAKSKSHIPRPISSTHWRRVVLDEAHVVKNRHTDMAKAVTELAADRRWCITGTPIQNRSSDIFSLLRFLKVHPYEDLKKFEQVFVQPWKNAESTALLKLQQIMSTLAIRRPRAMIPLPEKVESVMTVLLSPRERYIYEEARKGVVDIIDAAFGSEETFGGAYLNALQRINDLRYICNHGIPPERKRKTEKPSNNNASEAIGRELDMFFGTEDAVLCTSCGQLLPQQAEHGYLAPPTMRLSHSKLRASCTCSSSPSTVAESFTTISSRSPSSDGFNSPSPGPNTTYISSKVQALVNEIECTPSTEKCAVFSFRITTLRLISHSLTVNSIPHINYDGTMTRSKRDSVLNRFSSETAHKLKVILVSISCGGQGLDLTAANHAYLVEPQWNPMLEEQAMSRVYRLGQTRPVRLCRFVVQGTWEERIVDLQRRKKRLAELIVDQRGLESEGAKKLLASLRDLI